MSRIIIEIDEEGNVEMSTDIANNLVIVLALAQAQANVTKQELAERKQAAEADKDMASRLALPAGVRRSLKN